MKIESHPDYPQQLASGSTVLQDGNAIYEKRSTSNIENFVGTTRVPVGLAGPVVVHGDQAKGTFYIPMATTEGTLVASTSRGMKVMNECDGVRVKVVRNGGIQRAPVFEFDTIDNAFEFTQSINDDWSWLVPIMESTTSHGKVIDIHAWQLGRIVCVRMTMDPGDASGQNMVSISGQRGYRGNTQAISEHRALPNGRWHKRRKSTIEHRYLAWQGQSRDREHHDRWRRDAAHYARRYCRDTATPAKRFQFCNVG